MIDEPTVDQLEAYRLHQIERRNIEEIGQKFGVTGRTIFNWSRRVAEWMRAEQMDQIANLRTILTDRLDYIYSESVRGYQASKRDKVVTTETEKDTGSETKVQRTPQAAGDPAFLRIAKDAIMDYAELWHANMAAADRGTGVRAAGKTHAQMVDAQLERLLKLKRQLAKNQGVPLNGDGDRA